MAKERYSVRLAADEKEKIDAIADSKDVSAAAVVRDAVQSYLDAQERTK